jgi:transcriptional regulator with XRE-family HTH domain
MDIFAARLKERAQQLGISNAEAARRCGLDERRYAHYASGRREPDLATVVKIATTLGTTPNWLLGLSPDGGRSTSRSSLLDRLMSAAAGISDRDLKLVVTQAEALVKPSK